MHLVVLFGIMNNGLPRRSFLKKSVAASLAAPFVASLEEHRLLHAAPAAATSAPAAPASLCQRWHGTIGKVKLSRLICGGNLISGYAHSRDLIYVSNLLKHYFTEAKIIETWALCEQHGVDTMIFNPTDGHAVDVYRKYRKQGGRIQYLAQISPQPKEFETVIQQVVDD